MMKLLNESKERMEYAEEECEHIATQIMDINAL